jgi:phosphoserine aminotransferase
MEEAKRSVKQLMELGDDYEVLFLHGGATTQFMQVPMNLLDATDTAAYCINGIWGKKAAKEATFFGNVFTAADTADCEHTCIRQPAQLPADTKYLHITTNNTVEGTQWHQIPEADVPLVADMSSDIFSRVLDFNSFGLIYAGAQKNMGPAGVNLVVLNPALLGKLKRPIPTMMDYRNHLAEGSMLNTPPVFAVYVCLLTLRWLKKMGGIAAIEQRNIEKAALLYQAIDESTLFTGNVEKKDRSLMNVCFRINDESLEKQFLDFASSKGIVGIKGHRLSGGFRASLYNALPLSSVEVLVAAIKTFEAVPA